MDNQQDHIAYYRRGGLFDWIPVTWDTALDNFFTREEVLRMVAEHPEIYATKPPRADREQPLGGG